MSFDLARWRFPLVLALLSVVLLAMQPPNPGGDVIEYSLDTIALATHGTPDIRLADVERAKSLIPSLAGAYEDLARNMRANVQLVHPAFYRGRDGAVYSIHFFGYSALAVPAYKVLDALHRSPVRAFQLVNLAAIFILGLALRRFFRSEAKAYAGLALFMLCGGALYWDWTSPECMSAAALLAGMLFFTGGAPIAGAVLAGLAGQQNPTILFFFGFAPLLLLLQHHRAGETWAASLKAVLSKRNLLGLAAGMTVFAMPPLFNLYQFGVPSIIAKLFSDSRLVGGERLGSFFFDLNQGMVIAIPAVLATLLLWSWNRHRVLALGACTLFTLALSLPALSMSNWNSGAAGVMRYAFWAAMPFVFALLLRLREHARWPAPLVAGIAAVQLGCMLHASSYDYTEFSPLARTVLAHAPRLYHPDPEIFADRSGHNDGSFKREQIYVYRVGGEVVKTLYHTGNLAADVLLCGSGAMLAPDNRFSGGARGWRYIDGPLHCLSGVPPQQIFQSGDFGSNKGIKLAAGWNDVENNGGAWNGVWSKGERSRLTVNAGDGLRPALLTLNGNYLEGNKRTRLAVNGIDLGWRQLDQEGAITLPPAAMGAPVLDIELEHEAPHIPGPGDGRLLAFFLREVSVRGR